MVAVRFPDRTGATLYIAVENILDSLGEFVESLGDRGVLMDLRDGFALVLSVANHGRFGDLQIQQDRLRK